MKVNIHKHKNFTEKDILKLNNSVHVLSSILGSVNFKEAIREYSHEGKPGFYFRQNEDGSWEDQPHTNEEVYQKIQAGNEILGNVSANECDLYLVIDPKDNSTVIGYTYPSVPELYTYRNWFTSFGAIGYAAHLAHEWCHKLGFTHDDDRTDNREHSVPYAVGNLVGKIYNKLHITDSDGFPDIT